MTLKIKIITLLVFITLWYSCTKKSSEQPNVIMIYADDLGKGMISAYGQQYIQTPNIDRLINKGVSFTNAYSCSYSAPARASLLTGYSDVRDDKWKISQGGRFLKIRSEEEAAKIEDIIDKEDILLNDNDLYLPEIFKKTGYVTAEIGKLSYGFTATHRQMERQGWDYYYGYLDHVRCHGYYPPFLWENRQMIHIEGNTRDDCGKSIEMETPATFAERWNMEGKSQYSQNLFMEKTLQFIENHHDEPFFLLHATTLPHGPVAAPSIHPSVVDNQDLTQIEKEYASMVLLLDKNIGQIIDKLQQLDILDNTIIIFASDNGHEIYYTQEGRILKPVRNMQSDKIFDNFNDKYYSDLGGDVFNGNASMAGLKWTNLNGGINVPLTFYYPAHLKPNKINDVVALYDLLPTFADMLSVNLSEEKDGISLKDLIFDGRHLDQKRCVTVSSSTGKAVIRNDGFKLRHYQPDDKYELFFLPEDYQERNNLIEKKKSVFEEMK